MLTSFEDQSTLSLSRLDTVAGNFLENIFSGDPPLGHKLL